MGRRLGWLRQGEQGVAGRIVVRWSGGVEREVTPISTIIDAATGFCASPHAQ